MENDQPAALLGEILKTLKKIQDGLEVQDKRWGALEQRLENVGILADIASHPKDTPAVKNGQWNLARSRAVEAGKQKIARDDESILPTTDCQTKDQESFLNSQAEGSIKGQEAFFSTQSTRIPLPDTGSILCLPILPEVGVVPFPDPTSLALLQNSKAWDFETKTKVETIPYRDWGSPLAASPLNQNQTLQEQLGEFWTIPDDGRFNLLSREILEGLSPHSLGARCRELARFGAQMQTEPSTNFVIVDDCTSESGKQARATYRIGQKVKIRGPCVVPAQNEYSDTTTREQPWRRLM